MKFKYQSYPVLIQPTLIKEMRGIEVCPETINVGSSVTLAELEKTLKAQIEEEPGNCVLQFMFCNLISKILEIFFEMYTFFQL